ncbi:MAG: PEGA domain-containing protein [Deltaproteobacteria bacterium]|nr:MAG: PEGA domain-containing protein [Deltaproteobacteria bacterium]
MLARRAIAVSADKGIAKRIASGLMAAGCTAETAASLDDLAKGEIQAALVVLHIADGDVDAVRAAVEECAARLRKDAWILVVLPRSDLKLAVAALQASDRLAGVLVEDDLNVHSVAAMVTRALHGDVFGLEKVVPWGTRVYSALVGDYQEKSICIAELSEFAASMGVRRKYREAIEQVADELLMNALYDAPVDRAGKPMFADVPTKTRISLRMEQKAVVQYACDGTTFAISVRDSFGTLDRGTVIKYLHKCLYADQQIDRKAGGAGLGLYIMANASTRLVFNSLPGVATEVICTFDLTAPKVMLKEFGFFPEKIDAAGRLVGGRSQLVGTGPGPTGSPVERRRDRPPPASPAVVWGLAGAIALLLALIALVAYPRFAAPAKASIRVVTEPAGARVEIDGRVRGTTDGGALVVDDLDVGRAYKVTASKDGYAPATAIAEPSADHVVAIALSLEPLASTVTIESDPPGATVLHGAEELGTTPLTVTSLPAGQTVDLTFRKTGYREVVRRVTVPPPGGSSVVAVSLAMSPDFGSVSITSDPPGAQVLQNGELLAGVTTPVDELLVQAGKRYTFTLRLPGRMPATVGVEVAPGERRKPVHAKLAAGGSITVTANIDGRATVLGVRACTRVPLPLRNCPVRNGKYKVRIESPRPYASVDIPVRVQGDHVVRHVDFGIVQAADGCRIQTRRGRSVDKVALLPGTRSVEVLCGDGTERAKATVQVTADQPVTVP